VLDHLQVNAVLGGRARGGFPVALVDVGKFQTISGHLLHHFGELVHLARGPARWWL
jgi:hypothetical protein